MDIETHGIPGPENTPGSYDAQGDKTPLPPGSFLDRSITYFYNPNQLKRSLQTTQKICEWAFPRTAELIRSGLDIGGQLLSEKENPKQSSFKTETTPLVPKSQTGYGTNS